MREGGTNTLIWGVVTNLREVSVPLMTSQKADLSVLAYFRKSGARTGSTGTDFSHLWGVHFGIETHLIVRKHW